MRTADFDYALPPELIAQHPTAHRDESRLLVLDRATGEVRHRDFPALLDLLRAGDLLVLNNSRVIPARLRTRKADTGGEVELLLVEQNGPNDWWVMLRPGRRVRAGTELKIHDTIGEETSWRAVVQAKNSEGHCRVAFSGKGDLLDALAELGEMPLPPYIARPAGTSDPADKERYQTVYAAEPGSVAAPTAGLHFTPELLSQIRARGVAVRHVTLHVGLGTFAPVKVDDVAAHIMHEERYELPLDTVTEIQETRARGGRVVAVGTTTVRVLESAARSHTPLQAHGGRTRIFIYPPFQFRVVDALITNFHLPQSTLLMLVSAFARPGETSGREIVLQTYAEAVRERYRFFSYGDAMWIG